MTDTFNFERQAGANATITYRVRTAQFGDGYSQSVADGINNKTAVWPLSFEGSLVGMQAILTFFDTQQGYKSFYWTPPNSPSPLLFRVSEVSFTSKGAGIYGVSATFTQVFYP